MLKGKLTEAQMQLLRTSRQQSALLENLPVGVLCCKNDSSYSIQYMNKGFLHMTGYTEKEIRCTFQSEFLQLICPDDRKYAETTIREQLAQYGKAELEYRILCANGEQRWVLDQRSTIGTEGLCGCILVDTTAQKEESEQLRLNLERYKIITDQSTDIIFEWNFAEDTVYFSPNWKKKFGFEPLQKSVTHTLLEQGHIFQQDKAKLKRAMQKALSGASFLEVEVRIADSQGSYIWCRIRASTQYDQDGSPIRAVGMLTDISEDKAQRQQLLEQAQRDSLTQLLNKAATEMQVTASLAKAGDTSCALMIIDLDHFKSVNDRFGHLCGDAVLTDTAVALKRMFRVSDIMGRIGGDEFLVFVPDIDPQAALKKAHQLLQKLERIQLNNSEQHLSCSIGISLYPTHAENFSDLYRFADRALYQVKRSGRADAALYSETFSEQVAEDLSVHEERRITHADRLYVDSGQLLQETFRLLGSTADIPSAVSKVLEALSRWFHATHIYIWEYLPQQMVYREAFEWNELELPNPQQRNVLHCSSMDAMLDAAGSDVLFCCEDTDALDTELGRELRRQGVSSLMKCVMTDGGQRVGLLGCESHRRQCKWTQEQKKAFRQISDLLAVFLTKYHQQEKLKQIL